MTMIRVRAVINGVTGLPGLSTFYFSGAGAPPSVAEANDATGRVRAFWLACATQLAAGTTVLVQQTTDTIDTSTGELTGRTAAASAPTVVTSSGSGELPPATAGGVRLSTIVVVNRRLLQGRAFVSPLATTASTSGVPSTNLVTQLNVAGAALLSGASAISCCVWHRPSPGGSNGSLGNVSAAVADTSKLWVLRSRRD